jgi:heptosyltransferase III
MKRGSVRNRVIDRRIGIPMLWLLSRVKRSRSRPARIDRIGVLVSPTIGDNLLSSVVPQDLRREFPDATIIYFVAPSSFGSVDLLPCIDETIGISMTNPVQAIRAIRSARLDVLLDLTPWQRITAIYAALSNARYTVGFRSLNQHRHTNYDVVVEHSNHIHEVDNFRRIVRGLGVPAKAEPALKRVPTSRRTELMERPLVVLHPWASGERGKLREWPWKRWSELAARLSTSGCLLQVSGAPADREKIEAFCAFLWASGIHATPLIGSDGLRGLLAKVQQADLVVSVNTGIMHLAAIAGVNTICLSGPTSDLRWGPVGPNVRGLQAGPNCGFLHFGFEFDGNPTDCMEKITVDQVLDAAYQLAPNFRPRYKETVA